MGFFYINIVFTKCYVLLFGWFYEGLEYVGTFGEDFLLYL